MNVTYTYNCQGTKPMRAESWAAFLNIVHQRAQQGRFAAMVEVKGATLSLTELDDDTHAGAGGQAASPQRQEAITLGCGCGLVCEKRDGCQRMASRQAGRVNWGLLALVGMNTAVWGGIVYGFAKWLHLGQ